eukprot:472647_1
MSDHLTTIDDTKCNQIFPECKSAQNIKAVLKEYNKIVAEKESSPFALAKKMNEYINHKCFNERYSTVQLLNDFFHIKYEHNTNDNANQFNTFHNFLSNYEDALLCDITYCKGYKRYYRTRDELTNLSKDTREKAADNSTYSYDLMCRIHTFFMHSYETNILTEDEIVYVEQHLNNFEQKNREFQSINQNTKSIFDLTTQNRYHSKFITSTYQSLNCKKIAEILKENMLPIEPKQLEYVFDKYGYDIQLINDLCDCLGNKNDEDILLAQILINDLKCSDWKTRQNLYDLILHQCFRVQELNNRNFTKILSYTVFSLYPDISIDRVEQISINKNLNGNIFIKQTKEFTNCIKFAKLFTSINKWNKKQWTNIYRTINKWEPKISQVIINLNRDQYTTQKHDEFKYEKPPITNYTDEECMTDEHFVELFCVVTKAQKKTAVPFLIESHWNVMNAINKYYALSGDVVKLGLKYAHFEHIKKHEEAVYSEGIKFWYWKPRNEGEERMFIQSKYSTLKDEILSGKLTKQVWNQLQMECQILIQTDKIKQIASNGKEKAIYDKWWNCINNGTFTVHKTIHRFYKINSDVLCIVSIEEVD